MKVIGLNQFIPDFRLVKKVTWKDLDNHDSGSESERQTFQIDDYSESSTSSVDTA